MNWEASVRTIAAQHQSRRIDITTGHLVPDGRNRRGKVVLMDAFSASAMVQVLDKLSEENKVKLLSLNVVSAQDLVFKLVGRMNNAKRK